MHFLHRALSEKKGKKHYFKCNLDYHSYIIIILVHWGTHPIQEKKTVSIVDFIFSYCTWTKKPTSYLPAFFTKPESASASLQISQRKQSGCQFACMAFITRPTTNLPTTKQQHYQPPIHTNVCSKLKIKFWSNDVFLRLNAF